MWKCVEDSLGYNVRHRDRSPATSRSNFHPILLGRKGNIFPRHYELAVKTLVGGNAGDYDYELARILPTRLTKAAFPMWDSLPAAVQNDYSAVKEKLKLVQEAFPGCGEIAHREGKFR